MTELQRAIAGHPRALAGDVWLDTLTEREVVSFVGAAWAAGDGGSIIPVNADVARLAASEPSLAELVARGSLVVADGMPLIWAAWLAGNRLPERVTGSSLVRSLSEAAAANGRSVFLLGGAPGVPERAAAALQAQFPGLRVAGVTSPPFGFDATEAGVQRAVTEVTAAAPDLILVGLGFPRQERLIERLRSALPKAWCLACGAGIPMAAGEVRRAPLAMQRLGLEWLYRLAVEPRRLASRYLRHDLPFAVRLLAGSAVHRFRPRRS